MNGDCLCRQHECDGTAEGFELVCPECMANCPDPREYDI